MSYVGRGHSALFLGDLTILIALIKNILRYVIGAVLFIGVTQSLFGTAISSASEDGFMTQNRYALHRLLLLSQQNGTTPLFPISWRQDCSVLDTHPYLKSTPEFFSRCKPHSGPLAISDVKLFQSYNTGYPAGMNDGAIWQGVGYNAAASFGSSFNFKALRVSIQPVFGFSQNQAFALHPYPKGDSQRYSYWLHRIDYVQRFGDNPVYWIDPGYSEIELSFGSFHTGFSSSPFRTGPGIETSLLFSYNAPGIPRFYIGTSKPVSTPIGHFAAHYFYGLQSKSDYFDFRDDNRLTSIHHLKFQYSPPFYHNLAVGFNRTFQETYPLGLKELTQDVAKMFILFSENSFTRELDENWSPDNQLFTFYLRWLFPAHNFEIYGEWGRDDHGVNLEELFIQPDHSRAYLFGVQKSYTLTGGRLLGLGFELTQMDTPRNSLVRGTASNPFGLTLFPWGVHTAQTIGLTNKGQLLGNGYGLGANLRSLRLEYLNHDSFTRISVNKISHNPVLIDDPRTRNIVRNFNVHKDTFATRMTEILVTVHHTRSLFKRTELGVGIDLSHTLHRYHLGGNNVSNARFELTVKQAIGK